MAENRALSQWEIEALLNQIPGNGGPEDDVLPSRNLVSFQAERTARRGLKTYDFRRPDKFSKEQWATLQSMHETLGRIIGASFSSRLRTLVTVRLSSIDQGLYEEWQAQVPSQTVCYVLSVRPLSGNLVIEFNHDVASEVVDRLLGGTGVLIDRGREISDVENALLRSFSNVLRQALEETWNTVVRVRSDLQDMGFDAGLIQVAGPTDVVLTAFYEVNIGNHLGAMSICLPYTVIEPIASQLSTQIWFQSGRHGAATSEERRQMETLLARSSIGLNVRLGAVDLPASTIVDMQEGDTIVLGARLGRPLDVIVGERARFRGVAGVVGNRLAVRVTEVVEEERDDPLPPSTVSYRESSRPRLEFTRGAAPRVEPEEPLDEGDEIVTEKSGEDAANG
jgi:flagellar motor switch protein FliM